MKLIKITGLESQESSESPEDKIYAVYVICSYCNKVFDVKEGEKGTISHGICDSCLEKEMKKITNQKPKNKV